MALPKSTLISLNSPQGTTMILEACAANYPALRQNFEGQINGGFCGIASSVIIVNSLQYLRQADKKQKVTQESIFKISSIELLPEWIYGGITLAYLASLIQGACDALKIHVKISIAYGDKFSSLDEFRNFLLKIMSIDGVFAMANYRRQSIGVGASPHMSPIGAYHKGTTIYFPYL